MSSEVGGRHGVLLRLRGRLAQDDGISLVEILVSIVILGTALTAFAATAIQSMTVITRDEQLVRANQLASDELEGLRALQWEAVGFYTSDPGYTATASDGAATVTLGNTRPAGTGGLLPTQTITRDGIDYTVDVEIVWLDDPNSPAPPASDPDPKDYKELRATLSWSVQGREFEVHQRSTRRPTTDEVALDAIPDCVPGEIVDFDVSPSTVLLDPTGDLDEAISVLVTTCSASSTVTLAPSPRASSTLSEVPGSEGTEWTATFSRGTSGFALGSYAWDVTAHSSHGAANETVTVQFVENSTEILAVLSLDVTPSLCVHRNQHRLHQAVAMTATVTGADPNDPVLFSWTADAGSGAAGTGTDVGNGQLTYTSIMPVNTRLVDGNTTITVSVTRQSDGLTVTESFIEGIAESANAGGCPS